MYVKIVRRLEDEKGVSSSGGSLEEKVVPSEHHIFECLEACYRKVTVNKMSEFNGRMREVETVRIVTPMPSVDEPAYGAADVLSGKVEEDSPFEFIQCRTVLKEEDGRFVNETLIARDCTFYIMNNEGKTIDRITCL